MYQYFILMDGNQVNVSYSVESMSKFSIKRKNRFGDSVLMIFSGISLIL